MSNYKKYVMFMCSIGLLLLLVGVTYSFFNYTRTGSSNNFNVGNISFASQNEQTISINNLFPIDPTTPGIMNDSTKVGTYQISITGNTDYVNGLEYLVSVVDAHLSTSTGKIIPINLDITANNLGTEENDYFEERKDKDRTIYKKLIEDELNGNQLIMVGYIKPNTTGTIEGVNGSITIKAYLDEDKIAISDTYGATISTPSSTPQGSGTYVLNSNLSSQELNDCVNYLKYTKGFPGTVEEVTNYCMGETTSYGTITDSFSSFPADMQTFLIEHNIFIDPNNQSSNSPTNDTTDVWVDGRVVLTTSEWNAISNTGISFKIKVEANDGIWVPGNSLEGVMRRNAVMDNGLSTFVSLSTGINFSNISSNANGKGIYMRAGTENDANPIVYYRGDVNDNNVVFANKCWKVIRTTEEGGVKLIYNGEPKPAYESLLLPYSSYTTTSNTDSRWTFDNSDSSWNITIENTTSPIIEFYVPAGNNYKLAATGTSGSACGGTYTFYKNGNSVATATNGGGAAMNLSYDYGTLTTNDKIKMDFSGEASSSCPITFKLIMTKQGEKATDNGCDNKGTDTFISLSGTNAFGFNTYSNSLAFHGYMYGTPYTYSLSNWVANARFGSSFYWDGTNYNLIDDSVTAVDSTHHYSCNVTTTNGSCPSLRYVYYVSVTKKYFITLTNGDDVDDAIDKMHMNITDSNAKQKIETWYESNLVNYSNKIEDTVYCNNRTISELGGWNPNGGSRLATLNYTRNVSNYSQLLSCPNIRDAFTKNSSKGNQQLRYPIGLITYDEVVLAGGATNSDSSSFYLNSGLEPYWTMSPNGNSDTSAHNFYVENGVIGTDFYQPVSSTYGLRPVITIKANQEITNGTGTVINPYIIE